MLRKRTHDLRDDRATQQAAEPRRQSGRTNGSTLDLLAQLNDVLGQLIFLPQQFGALVTYEDIIGWFVDKRPPGDVAFAGAVLRTPRRARRVEIVQVFLDRNGEPVRTASGDFLARRIAAPGVDRELEDAFGDQDLIIVQ